MHDRNVVSGGEVAKGSWPPAWLARRGVRLALRGSGRNLGLLIVLVALIAIVSIDNPRYLSVDNLRVVSLQMAFVGIASVGTALLLITGNVDLSIGSIFAFAAVLSAILARDVPIPLALAIGVLVAGAIAFVNGALTWRIRISPLIITLGTLTLLRGVVLIITHGYGVTGVPEDFGRFAQAQPLGVPMPVVLLVVVTLGAFVILQFTTIGRHLYAVGGNRDASAAAGLKVRRLVLGVFVVNGLLVGLAGVLAASRYGSPDPSYGLGFEFDVITAVILGGVAFNGGEGGVGGVILAVGLLTVITSGFVSLGIDPYYANVVKGTILIVAVAADQLMQEQRERRQKSLAMREHARAEELERA